MDECFVQIQHQALHANVLLWNRPQHPVLTTFPLGSDAIHHFVALGLRPELWRVVRVHDHRLRIELALGHLGHNGLQFGLQVCMKSVSRYSNVKACK